MSELALFVCCTDLHFTTKTPACRTEMEFQQAQLFKLKQLLVMAEHQTEMKLVLCAGDFFDSATRNMDYQMLSNLIYMFNNHRDVQFITVAGNHDMRFHTNDLSNTPLNILTSACPNFSVAPCISNVVRGNYVVHLYAAEWGFDLEKLAAQHPLGSDFHKDKTHLWVGLTHRTVFEKTVAPWAEGSGITAEDLIKRCNATQQVQDFDYIITGDNHETFMVGVDDTTLINAGPMLRSSIDKMQFKPKFAKVWETYAEFTPYPILPASQAFNQEYVAQHKEIKEATSIDFDKLLTEINSSVSITNDFRLAIQLVVTKKHPELLGKLEKIINS